MKWTGGTLLVCGLIVAGATICLGQRTETRDAGGGKKLELVYNASDQVVEMRTLDQNGKLLGKVESEYRPGFLVPQHKTTAYWPDGKSAKSVAQVGFDENGNFTSEVITHFDESGKQSAGTRLTHDPFSGIYRCSSWDVAARNYKTVPCPAGEESGNEAEEAGELTRDQVMNDLELARHARSAEQNARRAAPNAPTPPSAGTVMKEVSVILPAQLHPGKRVSGSVVEGTPRYTGAEDLQFLRMELPMESQSEAATLSGWTIETTGESPQPADGPVSFTVPRDAPEFNITLRRPGSPSQAVSRAVSVRPGRGAQGKPTPTPSKPREFETAAVCLKGDVCTVRGPFSGDSTKTLAAFDSQPAPIVAETENTAYFSVPPGVRTGPSHLIVADAGVREAAALPIVVAEISFSTNQQEVREGEFALIHAMLAGPEELQDEAWRAGTLPPGVSLERARRLAPGLELSREPTDGLLLLVLWNASPEGLSLRGSNHQAFAFKLTHDSFERGEFKYQFVVEAAQTGRFDLRGTVLPFMAPVHGRRYVIN